MKNFFYYLWCNFSGRNVVSNFELKFNGNWEAFREEMMAYVPRAYVEDIYIKSDSKKIFLVEYYDSGVQRRRIRREQNNNTIITEVAKNEDKLYVTVELEVHEVPRLFASVITMLSLLTFFFSIQYVFSKISHSLRGTISSPAVVFIIFGFSFCALLLIVWYRKKVVKDLVSDIEYIINETARI